MDDQVNTKTVDKEEAPKVARSKRTSGGEGSKATNSSSRTRRKGSKDKKSSSKKRSKGSKAINSSSSPSRKESKQFKGTKSSSSLSRKESEESEGTNSSSSQSRKESEESEDTNSSSSSRKESKESKGTNSLNRGEGSEETRSSSQTSKEGSEVSKSSSQKSRPRNTDARRRLKELEENVVAKSRKVSPRATIPGAFAEDGEGRSSSKSSGQMEQDSLTKNRLRRGRSLTSSTPRSTAEVSLNNLERDVLSKTRVGHQGATVPGAVATKSGSRRTSKGSKRSSSDSKIAEQRARLSDLESDTLAKSLARAGRASSTTIDPAARKIAANNGNGSGSVSESSAYSSIRNLERDVLAKSISRSRSAPRPQPRPPLESVSEEASGSERILNINSPMDSYDSEMAEPLASHAQDETDGTMGPLGPPMYSASTIDSVYSEQSVGRGHTARVSPVEHHAASSLGGGSLGGDDSNALEAFVADTVVDATGVAIVMSDEERIIHEKRQSRRYFCYGCIAFIIITVAIVVPLVIVLGGSDSSDLSETAPTAPLTPAPSASPSVAPTSYELTAAVDFLTENGISEGEALEDRESPQFLALEWVIDFDPMGLDFSNPEEQDQWLQRYILATFYFATNGDQWVECRRGSAGCATSGTVWLTADEECSWLAVLCDDSNIVTGIAFLRIDGNNLVGSLPEEFFRLTSLQNLILHNNAISGTISESWGQLSDLLQIVFTGNSLSGSLPDTLFNGANKLTKILLGENRFEGKIPASLSQLPVTQLRLDGNSFNGTIPEELFLVETLQDLRLSDNSLSGTLSESFGELTALTNLQLQENLFNGRVPDGFGALSELQTLNLHGNRLTGTIAGATCTLNIEQLTADCSEVTCLCCTTCF